MNIEIGLQTLAKLKITWLSQHSTNNQMCLNLWRIFCLFSFSQVSLVFRQDQDKLPNNNSSHEKLNKQEQKRNKSFINIKYSFSCSLSVDSRTP